MTKVSTRAFSMVICVRIFHYSQEVCMSLHVLAFKCLRALFCYISEILISSDFEHAT